MSDDRVVAEWARTAISCIQRTVIELNNEYHDRDRPIEIAWGPPDRESAEFEKQFPDEQRRQQGLLIWHPDDFELVITKGIATPEACTIIIAFDEELQLPRSARELYNILKSCQENVSLVIGPKVGDSDDISLLGAQTTVPIEGLSHRLLEDAVGRLKVTEEEVLIRLSDDPDELDDLFPDHWKNHGGGDR